MSLPLWFGGGQSFDSVDNPTNPYRSPFYLACGAREGRGRMLALTERMVGHLKTRGWSEAKAPRNELNRQLGQLEEKRRAIASRLREGEVSGADKAGLEARLTNLDARILSMNQELAAADARVAQTAGVPGAVQASRPEGARRGPPEEVIVMGFVLAMTMVLPISIAIARRIWKRGTPATSSAPMSREMDERLGRLEQAMDAVAVEVERVGEGQRFGTRVLGAGAAEPLAVRAREESEGPR